MFLKDRKYIEKEVIRRITGDLEITPDEPDESNKELMNRLWYFLKKVEEKKAWYIFSLLYNATVFLDVQGCLTSLHQ